MTFPLQICSATREELPELIGLGPESHRFEAASLEHAGSSRIPSRGFLVGFWNSGRGDPFPDFLVVNDEDLSDAHAWLSSFLNSLSPISQWCRIWKKSEFSRLSRDREPLFLDGRLGAWVGAVIAECNVQSASNVNLRELSGTAALTSATFSAARALAVWGDYHSFAELAARHDDLSGKLREGSRPIAAQQMLPLWFVLSGDRWSGRPPAEERPLHVFSSLFQRTAGTAATDPQTISLLTESICDFFDLPDLRKCGVGPQTSRVEALDRLAARLSEGPSSPVVEALLGYGASLIDPGASVLPDLLRRHANRFPVAQVWAGAFAGLWYPFRVMADFNGLGRILAKELTKTSDLFSKPEGDVSFDELIRWIAPAARAKIPVRGMVARTLNVEIMAGITAPFPIGRSEQVRVETSAAPARQRAFELEAAPARGQRIASPPRWASDLTDAIATLERRVAAIEDQGAGDHRRVARVARSAKKSK